VVPVCQMQKAAPEPPDAYSAARLMSRPYVLQTIISGSFFLHGRIMIPHNQPGGCLAWGWAGRLT
jgi:hypothetical protein